MLISTNKKRFFLGDIILLSDNIFWHDFFCTTSADHETFIFDGFKCLNPWRWGWRGGFSVPNLEYTPNRLKTIFGVWDIFRVWSRENPPQTLSPNILRFKTIRNERFVISRCGTKKKTCQKILSESKVMSPRKKKFFFVLISI